MMDSKQRKDYLWLNLRDLPYFRALLRAVEASFYQDLSITNPILDLGCGDGSFASIAFDTKIDVGMDPWQKQLAFAEKTGAYNLVIQADGGKIPFPDESFNTVISNSVLEHIPEVDSVIPEVARVLKPGAKFIFCVPNQNFTYNLSISRWLERIKLGKLATGYRKWFNKISRHHHCDSQQRWQERLTKNNLVIDQAWDYFSPEALGVLEWGHYFGLPSLVSKVLFKRWIVAPTHWNLGLLEKLLRPYYLEPKEHPQGSYSFYVTHKLS